MAATAVSDAVILHIHGPLTSAPLRLPVPASMFALRSQRFTTEAGSRVVPVTGLGRERSLTGVAGGRGENDCVEHAG